MTNDVTKETFGMDTSDLPSIEYLLQELEEWQGAKAMGADDWGLMDRMCSYYKLAIINYNNPEFRGLIHALDERGTKD